MTSQHICHCKASDGVGGTGLTYERYSIASLPDDLLVYVLQGLDMKAQFRAGRVSRRWRLLAHQAAQMWRSSDIELARFHAGNRHATMLPDTDRMTAFDICAHTGVAFGGSETGFVHLWHVERCVLLQTLRTEQLAAVTAVTASICGRHFYTGDANGRVIARSVTDRFLLSVNPFGRHHAVHTDTLSTNIQHFHRRSPLDLTAATHDAATSLALSECGTRLYGGTARGNVCVWHLEGLPDALRSAHEHSSAQAPSPLRWLASVALGVSRGQTPVVALALPQEAGVVYVAWCGAVQQVTLPSATTSVSGAFVPKKRTMMHSGNVTAIALLKGNRTLLTCSDDNCISAWDIQALSVVQVVQTRHGDPVASLALSGDQARMYCGHQGGRITVWLIPAPVQAPVQAGDVVVEHRTAMGWQMQRMKVGLEFPDSAVTAVVTSANGARESLFCCTQMGGKRLVHVCSWDDPQLAKLGFRMNSKGVYTPPSANYELQ